MSQADLKTLLKRAVELVMPNLRHYYRLPRKGLVVKSYPSNGSYWADVQVLRNDESPDPDQPLLTKVRIPVMWAGPQRGVVCPPAPGVLCDVTWYDGDPNYPRISNFCWAKGKAPVCELGALVIQQSPNVYLLFGANGETTLKTPLFKVDGPMQVTQTITAAGNIHSAASVSAGVNVQAGGSVSDSVRSMAGDRAIYNGHHHVTYTVGSQSAVPGAQQ